jgi:hypothetical protein
VVCKRPAILGLPFGQDANHFMDVNFADSGDGETAQSFSSLALRFSANGYKPRDNRISLNWLVLDHDPISKRKPSPTEAGMKSKEDRHYRLRCVVLVG